MTTAELEYAKTVFPVAAGEATNAEWFSSACDHASLPSARYACRTLSSEPTKASPSPTATEPSIDAPAFAAHA